MSDSTHAGDSLSASPPPLQCMALQKVMGKFGIMEIARTGEGLL